MILTLTLNPAIDRNVTTDRLVFEDRAYILSTHESPGGRGINASRVIHSFGGDTLAIAISGGATGERFEKLLAKVGFSVELVHVKNEIRTNLTITDERGLTVKLNELGPILAPAELEAVEHTVAERIKQAEWLMICGSLPPGVPAKFISTLIEKCRKQGVKTLLDTDGEALLEGIEARPTVVTPNQQEAERLLNRALLTRHHCAEAVERVQHMGAEVGVLSLGSRGAMAAFDGSIVEAVPPRVDAVCPIGAGDAMAAAFVWALAEKQDVAAAVRWGVAAGTASAQLPGVSFASLEQTRAMLERVEMRQVR